MFGRHYIGQMFGFGRLIDLRHQTFDFDVLAFFLYQFAPGPSPFGHGKKEGGQQACCLPGRLKAGRAEQTGTDDGLGMPSSSFSSNPSLFPPSPFDPPPPPSPVWPSTFTICCLVCTMLFGLIRSRWSTTTAAPGVWPLRGGRTPIWRRRSFFWAYSPSLN